MAAKIIINLIVMLNIWWCPCVESSLVLLEEGVCYDQCVLWANSISFCPASFCTPRPNLPVTPGVSWLPTFSFQFPIMKRTSFWVLVLDGFVGLQTTIQLQLLQHYGLEHRLGLPWYWMDWLRNEEIILSFLRLHSSTAFQTLLFTMMSTPFLLRDSCPQ